MPRTKSTDVSKTNRRQIKINKELSFALTDIASELNLTRRELTETIITNVIQSELMPDGSYHINFKIISSTDKGKSKVKIQPKKEGLVSKEYKDAWEGMKWAISDAKVSGWKTTSQEEALRKHKILKNYILMDIK